MKALTALMVVSLFIGLATSALAYTVDGYAYLENQTDHSGVQVHFVRTAPSALTYDAYTNSSGYFSLDVELGVYDITYSKSGYESQSAMDQGIFANTTLPSVTLLESITTVDGYAYLENQTDHSSIQVHFVRTIPSALTYDAYTNSSGYFSLQVEVGTYDITYSKSGYFNYPPLANQDIYSNPTLPPFTLLEHTTIVRVPSQFSTIGGAIYAAFNGDTVLVADGVYTGFNNKDLAWDGNQKHLVVRSENGPDNCIIDCENDGRGFYFYSSSQTSSDIVEGFTIKNGSVGYGGGIYLRTVYIQIRNCIITNSSASKGGGIYCHSGTPTLTNLVLSGNSAGDGGGVVTGSGNPNLTNITIYGNSATGTGGGVVTGGGSPNLTNITIYGNSAGSLGGGVYLSGGNPNLMNMTIYGNSAGQADGVFITSSSSANLKNCVIASNDKHGIYAEPGSSPNITYCNVWNHTSSNFFNCGEWVGVNVTTNVNGDPCDLYYNIQLDPLFVNVATDDYHLQDMSSCIRAATASGCPIRDIEGTQRGNPPDIGAYENITDGDQSLPVTLSSFTVVVSDGMVELQWITESETNNIGFHVYRSLAEDGEYNKVSQVLIPGAGNSSTRRDYSFTDRHIVPGVTYWYKLEDVAFDGATDMHGPVSVTIPTLEAMQAMFPTKYALSQNFPNPFNPTTEIPYQLPELSPVRIEVYNELGQRVEVLINGIVEAGYHSVVWDAEGMASGIYFLRMEAGDYDYIDVRKMVLIQ